MPSSSTRSGTRLFQAGRVARWTPATTTASCGRTSARSRCSARSRPAPEPSIPAAESDELALAELAALAPELLELEHGDLVLVESPEGAQPRPARTAAKLLRAASLPG